jgi:hypothetical protein
MIGQIGPLVQVGKKKSLLAMHVLGGALGGSTMGIVLAFVGALAFLGHVPVAIVVASIAVAALVCALSDLGLIRTIETPIKRPTPRWFTCAFGVKYGIFAWGFDLGLTITSRAPYLVVLVLPLAAILSGNVVAGLALMGLYGAARAGAVAAVVSASNDYSRSGTLILSSTPILQQVVGYASLFVASLLLAGIAS